MKTEIIALLNNFDNDNLTQYQIENGSLNQSSQAKVTHAIIGAIEYQIKSQNNYLGGTLTDNLTKAVTSSNCTDTHEDYINSLNQQMTNAEQCITEMEEFISELKIIYKENVGDEYRPYTSADKKLLGKQMATASRLEGLERLKARGIKVEVPALEEVLKTS
jgi:capsule polysaccharide export protein KpsE/RkpR|tara:strand:+ start:606 stop:1091 length:486 start_codon:yes stop_codon:yes gene_type:complete